jgi:uncharacterized membrane protein YdbT with pleckstrin-like domain
MRPENQWFEPEKLRAYYFAFEAILLVPVAVAVGVLAYTGVLFEIPAAVLAVGGAALLAAVGFVTWWIPAFFRTADYRLGDDDIEYRRGVFFRQKTTVPYNRITNVDAAQGPVQRLLDAGKVSVHTAGYGGQMGAELTIDGVADFEDIKDQILAKVRRRPPEATESDEAEETAVARPVRGRETDEMLEELRRIRELLERGRAA